MVCLPTLRVLCEISDVYTIAYIDNELHKKVNTLELTSKLLEKVNISDVYTIAYINNELHKKIR